MRNVYSYSRFCAVVAALCCLGFTNNTYAKSASEIYESASGSIVVVYANASNGSPRKFGSGVVLNDGEVVTNYHVVQGAASLDVKRGYAKYSATLKYADEPHDVCILSVPGIGETDVVIGLTSNLRVGQRVFAIGAPEGLELTLSEGLISGLRENGDGHYIQISAPISPGSSGGGLFDEDGTLIGLPTFFLKGGQQLNFAVPVDWIQELQRARTIAPSDSSTKALPQVNRASVTNNLLILVKEFSMDNAEVEGAGRKNVENVRARQKPRASQLSQELLSRLRHSGIAAASFSSTSTSSSTEVLVLDGEFVRIHKDKPRMTVRVWVYHLDEPSKRLIQTDISAVSNSWPVAVGPVVMDRIGHDVIQFLLVNLPQAIE